MTSSDRPTACPSVDVEITARRIEEYARAIGDPNPRYSRFGRDATGMVAPPTFAAAFIQEPLRALASDRERAAAMGIDFSRVVFGEVEYRYHQLVHPDCWVRTEGQLEDRRASGDKEILTFVTRAFFDDGSLVAEATITLVRR